MTQLGAGPTTTALDEQSQFEVHPWFPRKYGAKLQDATHIRKQLEQNDQGPQHQKTSSLSPEDKGSAFIQTSTKTAAPEAASETLMDGHHNWGRGCIIIKESATAQRYEHQGISLYPNFSQKFH